MIWCVNEAHTHQDRNKPNTVTRQNVQNIVINLFINKTNNTLFFAYNIFQFHQLETQRRKKNDQQNEIFNISSDLLYIILTLFAVFRTFLVSVSSHISELILCRHTHSNFHTFRETKTAHYINKRPTNGSIRMERNGATAAATANRNMVHICCQSLNHT